MNIRKGANIALRLTAGLILIACGIVFGLALSGDQKAPVPVVVHQVEQVAAPSGSTATSGAVAPEVSTPADAAVGAATTAVPITSSANAKGVQDLPTPSPPSGHYNTANPGSVDTGPRPAPTTAPATPCETPTDYAPGVTLADPCP